MLKKTGSVYALQPANIGSVHGVLKSMTNNHVPTCWVISDGRAGIENQALGLADSVAQMTPLNVQRKRIVVREPWRSLPPWLWGDAIEKLGVESDALSAPWPDIIIATGRVSIPVSLEIKKRNRQTYIVQTQDPRFAHDVFDLIVPPIHDGLKGANVFPILGAPNRVTASTIASEASKLEETMDDLEGRVTAVLVGGPNKAFSMDEKWALGFAESILASEDADLLLTFSRRTPERVVEILTSALKDKAKLIYDPKSDKTDFNPYPGILGLADAVIVTCDSVNMITEVASTGRSLYVADLPVSDQARAAKFNRFLASVEAAGASRKWEGEIDVWPYTPLNETARAAEEIVRRWALRRAA